MSPAGAAAGRGTWRLRKEDGQVFGPADLATMRAWAAAGRVAPNDQVSRDGERWSPAPAFVDLQLNWMVETPDGTTYGPIHLEACRALAREGALPPDSRFRNIRTRTVLGPDATPAGAPPADAAGLPPAWTALARDRDQLADAARRWQTLYEEESEKSRLAADKAAARIRALEQETVRLHAAVDAAERDRNRLAQLMEQAQQASGEPGLATLMAMHVELSRSFEALASQVEEKTAENEALRGEAERVRREAEAETERAQQTIRHEREEADLVRQRMDALERAYAETVRSLREINDRYIRHRAETETPSAAPTPRRGEDRPAAGPAAPAGRPRGPRIRLTR